MSISLADVVYYGYIRYTCFMTPTIFYGEPMGVQAHILCG